MKRYVLRHVEAEAIQVTHELLGAHLWDDEPLPFGMGMGARSHHPEKYRPLAVFGGIPA